MYVYIYSIHIHILIYIYIIMLKPQYAINLPFNGIMFTFQPFVVCHWGWFRVAMHEKKNMLQVATVVSMLKFEEKMGRPHSTGESACYLLYYIAVIGGIYPISNFGQSQRICRMRITTFLADQLDQPTWPWLGCQLRAVSWSCDKPNHNNHKPYPICPINFTRCRKKVAYPYPFHPHSVGSSWHWVPMGPTFPWGSRLHDVVAPVPGDDIEGLSRFFWASWHHGIGKVWGKLPRFIGS